jgi:glucosylceramidase
MLLAAAILVACATGPRVARSGVQQAPRVPGEPGSGRVRMWLTTPDQRVLLAEQAPLAMTDDLSVTVHTIDVDERQRFQQMIGFGAAITGSSAWLINRNLSPGRRAELMRALFDAERGIGLSFMRLTIGASDFSRGDFTYDDLPPGHTDYLLEHFSLAPDTADVIPTVRQALAANPELRFVASPWTAPAWMKTNERLAGGSLKETAHAAYAAYLHEYVRGYAAAGIAIHALTLQNEPEHGASYPSMLMSPYEQAKLIGGHLGPLFTRTGTSTHILVWDHNWDNTAFPLAVLADTSAAPYVSGTAFHCYAGDVASQTIVHDAFPDKDIYFTECSGGDWASDFAQNLAWNLRNLVIGAPRNWSRSVVLWNLALDPASGPTNGGCSNCRGVVTIDPATQRVSYNVEYYALGHISKFVHPGACRIASTSLTSTILPHVAFRNGDGSTVLIVLNDGRESVTFKVRTDSRAFAGTLQGGAVATLLW